jgi:hypothetical protein
MEKIPCPQCGEPNYAASPACWACGAPLTGPIATPGAAPAPTAPEAEAPAVGERQPQAEPEATSMAAPDGAASDETVKPAEREARALRDKAYVTPPVDVEEGPQNLSEWIAYAIQSVAQVPASFKQALDEYDTRRGRKSGGMSSYGCVVTALFAALAVVLIVVVVAIVARGR